ncbi:GFA family protein [Rhizobium sp. AAP43]|uniref:GFA family protein n=1 Tax=Rhizobium sp. AAP43 TaxID=1523420 RepID=UPI0006B9DD8D|nr:GFA family protein [Rhizobium sp. AAP43]KPF43856.1 aldehyde-activating protein [Rhizobium sp. AAP43]
MVGTTGPHHGRCLCEAVTVTVDCDLAPVSFCHCSQCRRQTGLYYATTSAPTSAVHISGEEHVSRYRSSPDAERGFCRHCGSALFWKADGEEIISLMAGLFDKPTGLTGGYHIYCADKGDFYEISEALPAFDASKT